MSWLIILWIVHGKKKKKDILLYVRSQIRRATSGNTKGEERRSMAQQTIWQMSEAAELCEQEVVIWEGRGSFAAEYCLVWV